MTAEEKFRHLVLLLVISRVANDKIIKITSKVNSVEELVNKEVETKSIIGTEKYHKIIENIEFIEKNIFEMSKIGVKYILYNEDEYPQQLREIYDPPYILFYLGDICLLKEFLIGIVGSRKPTAYGVYSANYFAKNLAERGIVIVSGMAKGIDSESHTAALDCGGKTIAVLGGPLDNIYPKNNKKLFENIINSGNLVISEFPIGDSILPFQFVQRNRIISGLTQGLIVVEAGEKSGTLTTVDFALDQGKNVFAIPGNITSVNSKGTNNLIKQGAKLITKIEDVLEEYPFVEFIDKSDTERSLAESEKIVIKALIDFGPQNIEKIAFFTKIGIKDIIGILSVLEIKGYVKELKNNVYITI